MHSLESIKGCETSFWGFYLVIVIWNSTVSSLFILLTHILTSLEEVLFCSNFYLILPSLCLMFLVSGFLVSGVCTPFNITDQLLTTIFEGKNTEWSSYGS